MGVFNISDVQMQFTTYFSLNKSYIWFKDFFYRIFNFNSFYLMLVFILMGIKH